MNSYKKVNLAKNLEIITYHFASESTPISVVPMSGMPQLMKVHVGRQLAAHIRVQK
ncbi:hypothetical protein PD5205_02310 [Xanthomonas fragariae]|uniref:Uncharacterized protein n=1 Tax=Xanthomonas fragariae TaxID=48664 RepID=A0A1Y6H1E1_9XANT|nr:hypothetical protein NBC2815_02298 [Xanthomonas fragariae]SMQ99575.1 hypothetical protein PD885_02337 [Xanthomonas fragariae]SMR03607.1 hypothetical protein PD5205_02310 [Xanthomonas fragariae]